jgi:hypothetical protein
MPEIGDAVFAATLSVSVERSGSNMAGLKRYCCPFIWLDARGKRARVQPKRQFRRIHMPKGLGSIWRRKWWRQEVACRYWYRALSHLRHRTYLPLFPNPNFSLWYPATSNPCRPMFEVFALSPMGAADQWRHELQ